MISLPWFVFIVLCIVVCFFIFCCLDLSWNAYGGLNDFRNRLGWQYDPIATKFANEYRHANPEPVGDEKIGLQIFKLKTSFVTVYNENPSVITREASRALYDQLRLFIDRDESTTYLQRRAIVKETQGLAKASICFTRCGNFWRPTSLWSFIMKKIANCLLLSRLMENTATIECSLCKP